MKEKEEMKVKYLAHASFLLETNSGVRIITDPYEPGGFGGKLQYKPINEPCDIVLISHEHTDHNYTQDITGNPIIVKGTTTASGIDFKGVSTYHDDTNGSQRGENNIFVFTVDGTTFCHLGDLGHLLTPEHKSQIGKVDVLFIPVGGAYTIGAEEGTQIVAILEPKLVIPMHYKTPSIDFPLVEVSEFTKDKPRVKELGTSVADITLPSEQEIWVLSPALL